MASTTIGKRTNGEMSLTMNRLKIEDKRCEPKLGMYQFLINGVWIFVSPYEYHAFEIGDTVPEYILERRNE